MQGADSDVTSVSSMYVQFSLEVAQHPIETKDKNRHLRSRSKKERKITKATDSISFSARPRGRPSFIITLVPKINGEESGTYLKYLHYVSYGE